MVPPRGRYHVNIVMQGLMRAGIPIPTEDVWLMISNLLAKEIQDRHQDKHTDAIVDLAADVGYSDSQTSSLGSDDSQLQIVAVAASATPDAYDASSQSSQSSQQVAYEPPQRPPQRLILMSGESYQRFNKQALVELICQRDQLIRQFRKETYASNRDKKRQSDKFAKQLATTTTNASDNDPLFDIVRKKVSRLTSSSVISVAIRRCASNLAARRTGVALMNDVSHQTVCRCEIDTGACLTQMYRTWFTEELTKHNIGDIDDEEASVAEVVVISYKSDATNSTVWQHSKLHVTMVNANVAPLLSLAAEANSLDAVPGHRGLRTLGDLQRVVATTAEATEAIINKQLSSIGCPYPGSKQSCDLPGICMMIFMYCSDCGSDQVGYGKNCYRLVCGEGNQIWQFFIATICLMHQIQIIVKDCLLLIDSYIKLLPCKTFSYYSLIAKITILWRDNLRSIFYVSCKLCGSAFALKNAYTKIRKANGGRWGVVFAVQSRLVEFGMLLLTCVFNRTFRWKADNGSEEILEAGLGVNLSVSECVPGQNTKE